LLIFFCVVFRGGCHVLGVCLLANCAEAKKKRPRNLAGASSFYLENNSIATVSS